MKLHLDFETRSRVNLKTHGLDIYARDPSTRVLMLAWAVDGEKPHLWEPHKGKAPRELIEMIKRDPSVTLCAHNSTFERTIFKHVLGVDTPIERWRDTMVMAYYCGLVGELGMLGEILRLKEEVRKMKEGRRLIDVFCKPRKPTKEYSGEFHDWVSRPEDWELFGKYCRLDVVAERQVDFKLSPFDLPPWEWRMWALDQKINDTGMPVDPLFITNAQQMSERHKRDLRRDLIQITGLKNPASGPQFREWAKGEGYPFGDLRKGSVKIALKHHEKVMSEDLCKALELREVLTMTSLSKLDTIARVFDPSTERLRYAYQFMGASRTGRWAGRKVQTQNLKRPLKEQEDHLEEITDLIRDDDYDTLAEQFGLVRKTLAGTIRSAFRAPVGKKLCVADLSSIEDVVVGWLARCEKILDDHRTGRDPYLSFAVFMFHRAYESFTKKSPERQIAKPGRLGCCYRLSAGEIVTNKNGDLVKTGLWGYAESMGIDLTQEQCRLAVCAYRETYKEVVQFWYDLEEAAVLAIKTRQPQTVGYVTFDIAAPFLRMKLPSGRYLHYLRPKVEMKKFKVNKTDELTGEKYEETYWKEAVSYEGLNQDTKQWTRVYTHGGKLCENATQAVARDLLCMGLLRADKAGFEIVGHVHDECISLIDEDADIGLDDLIRCMTPKVKWAPGLPLKADGWVGDFYQK